MPSLGADMEVGTIIEWRVRPGDTVHRGDIVALVDTEKSDIAVEIFDDGVVAELLVEPGVEVPVGTVLARLAPAGTATPVSAPGPQPAEREPAKSPEPTRPSKRRQPARPKPRRTAPAAAWVPASPLARRLAAEQAIDLGAVVGSGPGGAVRADDLVPEPTMAAAPPRRPAAERQAVARSATGALMARSKREVPHYYLATTIDLARAMTWMAEVNATRPVAERLLPASLLLKATALAAREVPLLNGFWDGGYRPSPAVNLGVAVSLRGGGLIAPAIADADRLELGQLMARLRDLVARARSGELRSSDVSGATITVTNLGDQGVEEVFGVIYPPQVALVGFGRIAERPWAVGGMLGVRPVVRATLSADHRASDGHEGSRFLAALDDLLGSPETL
jgi:pyruvate dehydrogenase E2 component (dihydrolipoamide acetyltransferase)